ncbi:hypothetical protein WJX84_003563 [Apatococcus fuscideae]|uniref:Uncharacterized protein n=1 Tax=Apatococcus fuscideae TaxID=2026836 RepID=A0AAW1SSH3_9CHLO
MAQLAELGRNRVDHSLKVELTQQSESADHICYALSVGGWTCASRRGRGMEVLLPKGPDGNRRIVFCHERKGIMKFMAVALHGLVDETIVELFVVYARYQQLRDQPSHTHRSIEELERKIIRVSEGILVCFGQFKSWQAIPKFHKMRKYPADLRHFGFVGFGNTGQKERFNQQIRQAAQKTKFKDPEGQLSRHIGTERLLTAVPGMKDFPTRFQLQRQRNGIQLAGDDVKVNVKAMLAVPHPDGTQDLVDFRESEREHCVDRGYRDQSLLDNYDIVEADQVLAGVCIVPDYKLGRGHFMLNDLVDHSNLR